MAKKTKPAQTPVDAALTAARLPLEDVAAALGVKRPTLVSWMQGHRPTPPEAKAKLVDVLREYADRVRDAADQLERGGSHVKSMRTEPVEAKAVQIDSAHTESMHSELVQPEGAQTDVTHTEGMQAADALDALLTPKLVASVQRLLRRHLERRTTWHSFRTIAHTIDRVVDTETALGAYAAKTGVRTRLSAIRSVSGIDRVKERRVQGLAFIVENVLGRMPNVERRLGERGEVEVRLVEA